eukprot:1421752-Amphidinium_carterae.3
MHLPCCALKEATWALYAEEHGVQRAEGDACEACYKLHKRAFQFLSWTSFCKEASDNAEFGKIVSSARKVAEDTDGVPKPSQESVNTHTSHGIQIQRSYLCVTERDMRRIVGAARLPKSVLKGLVSITVPTEDSKSEEVAYLFQDPESPFRKAVVTVDMRSTCSSPELHGEDCLFEGQGKRYSAMAFSKLGNESVAALVAKEKAGHLTIGAWTDFVSDRLSTQSLASAAVASTDESADLVTPVKLSGVAAIDAASSAATQGSGGDSGKKDKPCSMKSTVETPPSSSLTRLFSAQSLGSNPVADTASVAGTAMTAASSVADDEDEVLQGSTPVEYWRAKLPLEVVLRGGQDKRTLVGLKRAQERFAKKKGGDAKSVAQLLSNLVDVIQSCIQIDPEHFENCTNEDLSKILKKVQKDIGNWPADLQNRLLMRRTSNLLDTQDTVQLLETLDPFKKSDFDPLAPTLSNITLESEDKRMASFRKLIFQDTFIPLLLEGDSGAKKVMDLCSLCIHKFETVDVLDLENSAASTLSLSLSIWRAIHALRVPSDPVDAQDGLGMSKKHQTL